MFLPLYAVFLVSICCCCCLSVIAEAKALEHDGERLQQADYYSVKDYVDDRGGRISGGRQPRIIGGSRSPRPLPFLAAIRLKTANNYHYCAGAVVDQWHVVTAAHCILPQMRSFPSVLSVRLNVTDINNDEEAVDIEVARILTHPQFNNDNFYHDMAILSLKSPVPQLLAGGEESAVRLPAAKTAYDGRYAAIAGWGVTRPPRAGDLNARFLNYLIEQVMPRDTCEHVYKGIVNPQFCDCQLCAGGQLMKDACQGDSGAPMWVIESDGQPTLIGIVSTGTGCGMANRPGIFTDISSHLDFLEQNTLATRGGGLPRQGRK